jgi:hypothetical protein
VALVRRSRRNRPDRHPSWGQGGASPAETARGLSVPGLAGRLAVVPLRLTMCRCEPLHSSSYGHMAEGIRPGHAVHRTACPRDLDGPVPATGRSLAGRQASRPEGNAPLRASRAITRCWIVGVPSSSQFSRASRYSRST